MATPTNNNMQQQQYGYPGPFPSQQPYYAPQGNGQSSNHYMPQQMPYGYAPQYVQPPQQYQQQQFGYQPIHSQYFATTTQVLQPQPQPSQNTTTYSVGAPNGQASVVNLVHSIAVKNLPVNTVTLEVWEKMTPDEIAEMLSISVNLANGIQIGLKPLIELAQTGNFDATKFSPQSNVQHVPIEIWKAPLDVLVAMLRVYHNDLKQEQILPIRKGILEELIRHGFTVEDFYNKLKGYKVPESSLNSARSAPVLTTNPTMSNTHVNGTSATQPRSAPHASAPAIASTVIQQAQHTSTVAAAILPNINANPQLTPGFLPKLSGVPAFDNSTTSLSETEVKTANATIAKGLTTDAAPTAALPQQVHPVQFQATVVPERIPAIPQSTADAIPVNDRDVSSMSVPAAAPLPTLSTQDSQVQSLQAELKSLKDMFAAYVSSQTKAAVPTASTSAPAIARTIVEQAQKTSAVSEPVFSNTSIDPKHTAIPSEHNLPPFDNSNGLESITSTTLVVPASISAQDPVEELKKLQARIAILTASAAPAVQSKTTPAAQTVPTQSAKKQTIKKAEVKSKSVHAKDSNNGAAPGVVRRLSTSINAKPVASPAKPATASVTIAKPIRGTPDKSLTGTTIARPASAKTDSKATAASTFDLVTFKKLSTDRQLSQINTLMIAKKFEAALIAVNHALTVKFCNKPGLTELREKAMKQLAKPKAVTQ